jgi:hypothetical protein
LDNQKDHEHGFYTLGFAIAGIYAGNKPIILVGSNAISGCRQLIVKRGLILNAAMYYYIKYYGWVLSCGLGFWNKPW